MNQINQFNGGTDAYCGWWRGGANGEGEDVTRSTCAGKTHNRRI